MEQHTSTWFERLPGPLQALTVIAMISAVLILAILFTHRDRLEWDFWRHRYHGLHRMLRRRGGGNE